MPEPAPLTQPSSQQQAMFAQFTQAHEQEQYQWTGSSINSLHNLGVAVLTPARLPQCTPITAAPAATTAGTGAGTGAGVGQALGPSHGQGYRGDQRAQQQQQQADEQENMLFLHSMLNDTFADLAQDDLFAPHRDSTEYMSMNVTVNMAAGGNAAAVPVGGALSDTAGRYADTCGPPSMDPDGVIERWLQSARSPAPATAPPQHAFCTPQQQLCVGDK